MQTHMANKGKVGRQCKILWCCYDKSAKAENSAQVIREGIAWLLAVASSAAVLPYGQVYRRNTLLPIIAIIGKNDEADIRSELSKWFKVKLREAQYVQVAVRKHGFAYRLVECRIYDQVHGDLGRHPLLIHRLMPLLGQP